MSNNLAILNRIAAKDNKGRVYLMIKRACIFELGYTYFYWHTHKGSIRRIQRTYNNNRKPTMLLSNRSYLKREKPYN